MPRSLRRPARAPFPYVLEADRSLPTAEQPRWIVRPPTGREYAEICDQGGNATVLVECVVRCVEQLENHPDTAAFGRPQSAEREAFVDQLDVQVIRELGNAVANTMLSEGDRKNSDSPSVSGAPTGGAPAAAATETSTPS